MTDWQNRIVGHGTQAADQFIAHPNNPRVHPQKQRDAMKGSLDSLGWIAPVIVNKTTGYMIDGHERVWQALQNDNAAVPFIEVELDEHEEALALASFDFITYMAQYDTDQLDALLQQVNTDNTAMQSLLSELAEDNGLYFGDEPQMQDAPEAQIDRAEELLQKWGVVAGDIWEIPSQHGGVHRLMCGDSTSAEDVALLMGEGEQPSLMVTDPPYGVEYDAGWRDEAAAAGLLQFAKRRTGAVANDDQVDWQAAIDQFNGNIVYCWHAGLHASSVAQFLERSGFEIRYQLIWAKPHFVIGRGHYHPRHEPCWYAVRKGKNAAWIGPKNEDTVWNIHLDKNAEGGHSTQKPVECMARPIRNHEGNVYDPFLGSGTTMVAAETLKRVCFGMELEPKYCAVILQRMQDMSLEPRKVN